MSSTLSTLDKFNDLCHLHLHFDNFRHTGLPSWVDNREGWVTLNRALHRLSQRLTSLRLLGRFVLTPDLFWPDNSVVGLPEPGSSGVPAPFWSRLQTISIEARVFHPEGSFYLPDVSDGNHIPLHLERFDQAACRKLVTMVARAMLQMPLLEQLEIGFPELTEKDRLYRFFRTLGFPPESSPVWAPELAHALVHYDKASSIASGAKVCRVGGSCRGRHDQFRRPWRWPWGTSEPEEAVRNWESLVVTLCNELGNAPR